MSRRILLGLLLTVAVIVSAVIAPVVIAPVRAASPKLPRWASSIEAGLAEAEKRGCVLVVALNMDGERGNQGMLDDVYTSDEFNDAAKSCVVAVASLGDHALAKDPQTGRSVCDRFGTVTCEEHQAIEGVIRTQWLKRGPKDDVESPRHFFLAPGGKILFQRTWAISAKDLAALMKSATAFCTPEMLAIWDTTGGRLVRITDPNELVRQEALRALVAENDPAVDKKILAAAKKPKADDLRLDVIAAFAGAEQPGRRDVAYGFLSDKDADVRLKAAYALEKSKEPGATAALVKRLGKEKEEKVKAGLCRAVGVCGAGNDKARTLLLKWAKKTKFGERKHAVVALRAWATDKKVAAFVSKLAWDDDASNALRSAAIWIIGYSGRTDMAPKIRALARSEPQFMRLANSAADKLDGKVARRYDAAPRWFARHPAEPWEGWGGR